MCKLDGITIDSIVSDLWIGIVPVRRFPERCRFFKANDVKKLLGIVPLRLLMLRSIVVKFGRFPSTAGRTPTKELFLILIEVSLVKCEITSGKLPDNAFELRSMFSNISPQPWMEDKSPCSIFLLKSTVTQFPSSEGNELDSVFDERFKIFKVVELKLRTEPTKELTH